MNNGLISVSVVVPVYNSEESLEQLTERLKAVLQTCCEHFELVLVEDGSLDGSWQVAERIAHEHSWVRAIKLMRNFGQHNALLCGIRKARYEYIVTMDDDLQNPPEEIPKLIKAMQRERADVVYGCPKRETHGLLRDVASLLTKMVLQKAMGAKTAKMISAFRLFRTSLREAFIDYSSPYVSIDVLLTWGGARFIAIRVRQASRLHGQSNYTLRKLVRHALNMTTGFSVWPLKLASLLGFSLTGFGALILVYVLARYLYEGSTVAGFPFLAATIAIFSGAQLFCLGILGEYLARMHYRVMGRPSYVIENTTTNDRQLKSQF